MDDGEPPLVVEYDDRNSLQIGYATFGAPQFPKAEPQLNLYLLDDQNQNITGGQKLLLHWHHRFGHLNFPAVQRILRAVPFLSAKFEAASKCDHPTLKCSICEFAKGHRRAKKSVTQVPNDNKIGALKVEHLKPGAQVSVNDFESRLLGRKLTPMKKPCHQTTKVGASSSTTAPDTYMLNTNWVSQQSSPFESSKNSTSKWPFIMAS